MPRAKRTSTRRKPIRRIAINTGGGDAPGLNAVIRAVVLTALKMGWEVVGILDSYDGLFEEGGVIPLDRRAVRGITHIGGTILGTTNRGNPSKWPVTAPDGTVTYEDRTQRVVDEINKLAVHDSISNIFRSDDCIFCRTDYWRQMS